jgi:hypothetical protein
MSGRPPASALDVSDAGLSLDGLRSGRHTPGARGFATHLCYRVLRDQN